MKFDQAAKLGSYLAKPFAEELLRLLLTYQDISASEAASRLNLHISTAQDFLEAFTELGILDRREAREGKRPYYRYSLLKTRIALEIDLAEIGDQQADGKLDRRIRERPDNEARFTVGRSQDHISSVNIWTGRGRERKERRISLTTPQGRFLFHLPFPNAEPATIADIMNRAEVDHSLWPEIVDLVDLLQEYGVIQAQ